MKKRSLKMIAFAMVLCVSAALGGCAAHVCETDEVISLEEQTKAEEIRRSEIAEQYSVYEPYGMTYDEEKDRFYYNGQIVRYFKDEVSAENTNAFFFEDGVVDVEPMKDTNGSLTGLNPSSDADFKARTEKQDAIKAESDAAGIAENSGCFESGDPNYRDDSLDAYTAFGVSYDQAAQKWTYDGKIIHILYDADHITYYDAGAGDGINLKVIRDKNGSIKKLMETEAQSLFLSKALHMLSYNALPSISCPYTGMHLLY